MLVGERVAHGEHTSRGGHFDDIGAMFDLRPNSFSKLVHTVRDLGIARKVEVRVPTVDVRMAARRADASRRHPHARTGDDAAIYHVAKRRVEIVSRADVPNRREARFERDLGMRDAVDRFIGNRLLKLVGVTAITRPSRNMYVTIDEPRQDGVAAEIDHAHAGRNGDIGPDRFDLAITNDDNGIRNRRVQARIHEKRRAHGNVLAKGRERD